MAFNYRCSDRNNCGARKTLKKDINLYRKRPLCPSCKKDTLKTVNAKEKARNKRRTCRCDGYSHEHHKGTEPWCDHAKIGPDEQDWKERGG